jgi:hypothetical protein
MDLKSLGALLAEEFHDVLCRHKPRTAHDSALEAFVELSGDWFTVASLRALLRLHDVSNPRAVTA